MILVFVMATGWVMASAAVYAVQTPGGALPRSAMLGLSALCGAGAGHSVACILVHGTQARINVALSVGALAFTAISEVQLIVLRLWRCR